MKIGDLGEDRFQRRGVAADLRGKTGNVGNALDRAFGPTEFVADHLTGRLLAPLIPDGPGDVTGLAAHDQTLLGVACVFMREALTMRVHLDAASCDHAPVEPRHVRRADGAVTLK